jgi:hypothetical protein
LLCSSCWQSRGLWDEPLGRPASIADPADEDGIDWIDLVATHLFRYNLRSEKFLMMVEINFDATKSRHG